MAADVVGYPRLMETDEAGTLAAIKVLRANVIDPLIAEHHGGQGGGVPLRDAMAVLSTWGALRRRPEVQSHAARLAS